ncbi:Putative RING-H2 finger protein ATL49 [Linum perenne]
MTWVFFQIKETSFLSTSFPPPPLAADAGDAGGGGAFNLESKVSPSILLIIIILAIVFFISGLLHLLVRFLIRPPPGSLRRDEFDNAAATALQGQLQQLFHLHDSGVDQSFIDTLPIFLYKSILVGPGSAKSDPFDCAVCLSEFEPEDKLRLLPNCSHAFHMDCIDTWLLSHSTCPLCRSSLNNGTNSSNSPPILLVLESGSQSSGELVNDRESNNPGRSEFGSFRAEFSEPATKSEDPRPERVFRVKLGKFRNVENRGNGGEVSNVDVRRCYSMGSFEYVMDENSSIQVPITKISANNKKKNKSGCHRGAMSVCGIESAREFGGFGSHIVSRDGKTESFSISETGDLGSKRGAVSFRAPTSCELGFCFEEGSSQELGGDSSSSQVDKTPSFARRTLLWLSGKQSNKVVHSNFTSNV